MSTAAAGAENATPTTWPRLLTTLLERRDLTPDETRWAMNEVMIGEASPVQLAGFLVALRAKGLTVGELTGLADEMLAHAHRISVPGSCVDVVGTGGDLKHTVNVSTMAALTVAGAGVRVVKHGNRAASSSTGTADVLEALGLRLDHEPSRVAELAEEVGITFCFAQRFHPSMRHAGPVRKGLGVPTVFNFLGPLTNPAQPRAVAIGVPDARMADLMAGVLAARGTSGLVFRGPEGLDELAPAGPSSIWWVRDGAVTEHELDAASDVGLEAVTIDDLRGGMPAENADVVRRYLSGERGPVRETVLLNAAAALVAEGSTPGTDAGTLAERLRAGVAAAAAAVDDGRAAAVLDRWVAASQAG